MASGIIFPTSVFGQLSDVYGTNIPAYANSGGFPAVATGLVLGMFGILFDGSQVQLFKAANTINISDCCGIAPNQGNDYTVNQLAGVANVTPCAAVNDRGGQQLNAGGIAWMTVYGNAQANVAAGLTAPSFLSSSGIAGRLGAYTVGSSIQTNLLLLNATTIAGIYPISIL